MVSILRTDVLYKVYLSGADITGIFPPFIIKHLNGSFLLELQDRQRERVPPLGALGSGDTVPSQLLHITRDNQFVPLGIEDKSPLKHIF